MSITERFAKLEPRERQLLLILVGIFAAVIVLGVPIALYTTVSTMRDENQAVSDVIDTMLESKDKLEKQRADKDARDLRYARKAPPMATFLEDAARDNEVELAETTTKADLPHGKKYIERITVTKMRKVGLRGLAKTLEKVARSGFPVAITRLGIKPRVGEPDSYDVDLSVSAFEKRAETKKKSADATDEEATDDAAAEDEDAAPPEEE